MCNAALKQELNCQIDSLPDERVQLLIEVAKSMKPSVSSMPDANNASHTGAVDPRALGALKGSLIYMADDFDETPDCFKEYV